MASAAPLQTPPSAGLRPWGELVDLSAFSLPISLSEISFRIRHNVRYFRLNYANIFLIILFLSLVYHPLAVIVFLATVAAWFYFYISREEPLVVFDRTVDDRAILVVLSFITLIVLVWTSVWWNILASTAISAVVICLHGAIRVPEEVNDQESPYGSLLDSPRGGYSQV